MVEEGLVDRSRGVSPGKGGEMRGLSGRDELLRCPSVLWGGSSEERRPVCSFRSLNCFKVAVPRVLCQLEVGRCVRFLGNSHSFRVFFAEGGEDVGPPGFGVWGGFRGWRHRSDQGCEGVKRGREPVVELGGEGLVGGGGTLKERGGDSRES